MNLLYEYLSTRRSDSDEEVCVGGNYLNTIEAVDEKTMMCFRHRKIVQTYKQLNFLCLQLWGNLSKSDIGYRTKFCMYTKIRIMRTNGLTWCHVYTLMLSRNVLRKGREFAKEKRQMIYNRTVHLRVCIRVDKSDVRKAQPKNPWPKRSRR